MGRFRLYTDSPHTGGTRGQDTHVEFIDDDGNHHKIKNCTAAKVLVSNRYEPVELHLCLVGQLEIDISTEIAATLIKQDRPDKYGSARRSWRDPPIQNIPLKKP